MKILRLLPIALVSVAIGLAGCASIPTNSCDNGTISLQVGPFFAQHATIQGAAKQADGSVIVGHWVGSTTYLGIITFTQEFSNLHVSGSPLAQPTPVTLPAK